MATLTRAIDRLLASVTDGRTENTRFRQDQLHALHASLKSQKTQLCSAISSSSSCTTADAEAEYFLTLDAIHRIYETLDFEKALKLEYSITTGVDNVQRKVGAGLVAVKPGGHDRLYCAVVPVAAAVAAGNCVVLELSSSSPIDKLLQSTLNSSMDLETFFASTTEISESEAKQANLVVNQQIESQQTPQNIGNNHLASSVAIVERSADLKVAVKCILDARLFSNGTSPYAPDLVIVNEWIVDEFRAACASYIKSLQSTSQEPPRDTSELVASLEKECKVHTDIPGLAILEVGDKNSQLLTRKLDGPLLTLVKSSSLINSTSILRPSPSLLALYIFADPKSSKFLSEQIPSAVSYINQIPAQLLIGPASPSAYLHQLHPRYTPEMFQVSRPQIVEMVRGFEREVRELKPTGQKPGKAIGFFEQGILIGLGVAASVVLPSLGYAGFRIVRAAWGLWKRG